MFTNNEILLTIFFLYLIISTNYMGGLLSCDLQRLIQNTVFLKHIFMFISLYMFIYILGYNKLDPIEAYLYTRTGRYRENFDKRKKKEKKKLQKDISEKIAEKIVEKTQDNLQEVGKYMLLKFLGYSILFYSIFLLTTKCELNYLGVFFILLFISFMLNLYKNAYLSKFNKIIPKSNFINDTNKIIQNYLDNQGDLLNIDKIKKLTLLRNIEVFVNYIAIFVLIIGNAKYFNRQYSQHSRRWNWLTFIFGSAKCNGINY